MTTQQQTNNNNKGCQPFKYPGCQLNRRQRGLQQWGKVKKKRKVQLFVYTSLIRNNSHQSEHRPTIFLRQNPFCLPGLLWSAVNWSMNMCTAACQGAKQLEEGSSSLLIEEIDWHELQCSLLAFPWKLQAFNRPKISKIDTSQKFCQSTEFYHCFLLCHLPRILLIHIFLIVTSSWWINTFNNT